MLLPTGALRDDTKNGCVADYASYRAEYLRILCNQLDPNKDESTDNRVFDSELSGTAIP